MRHIQNPIKYDKDILRTLAYSQNSLFQSHSVVFSHIKAYSGIIETY